MIAPRVACPVRRVLWDGRSSRGIREPSSYTVRHRGSMGWRSIIWAPESPMISSAAGLWAAISPVGPEQEDAVRHGRDEGAVALLARCEVAGGRGHRAPREPLAAAEDHDEGERQRR